MIRRLVGNHKTTWHQKLYSMLWAYRTSVKTAIGFMPFQLAFILEGVLPIECEIPSLKLAVELLPGTTSTEERLLSLDHLDETRRDATLALEAHQRRVKAQYDKSVKPRSSKRAILFFSTIRNMTSSGQEQSNHYGLVLTSSRKSSQNGLTNFRTAMEFHSWSPATGSI